MLLEWYGNAATATMLACEALDDAPVLRPVRNVRRDGRLLFAPYAHASQGVAQRGDQSGDGDDVVTVSVAVSTSTFTAIVSASVNLPYASTVVITSNDALSVVNSGSTNPVISPAWTIEDEVGATYGGGSLTLPAIRASNTAQFPIVQETTVAVPANTAETFTMLVRYGTTRTTISGGCTGVIKLETIKQ